MVSGRKPNIARRQEAARLRRAGLSLPEIGRRLGITKQAVHQLLTPRPRSDARQLTEALILQLADEYHEATGEWPQRMTGVVRGRPGEKWSMIDNALRYGLRGLRGGTSLARLLAERRGVGHRRGRPPGRANGQTTKGQGGIIPISEDNISLCLQAQQVFEEAERKAEAAVANLRFKDWRSVAGARFSGLPLAELRVEHQFEDGAAIRDAFALWHFAKQEWEAAWKAVPESEREGLNVPPDTAAWRARLG
jgi:hypothetical protein